MQNKMICLESKQIMWLDKNTDNASELLRSLLQAHINSKTNRTREDIDKEIARLEAQIAYEKTLEAIDGK